MTRVRLGVNIDHVATVRQARRGRVPDPMQAAAAAARAGADSIVCHLREDRRHIQDEDVRRLVAQLDVPVNLEMSIAESIVAVALRIRPAQVTLVPERRQELTTEGGLNVRRYMRRVRALVERFRKARIPVSLFIDPVSQQIEASTRSGAEIVELHTGEYARTSGAAQRAALRRIIEAARIGRAAGLSVAAGHGLDYENVQAVVAIRDIEELNIGFSIVSESLFVGMTRAVGRMRVLMRRSAD
jgi:pyridoxine 5-phosphate synthase